MSEVKRVQLTDAPDDQTKTSSTKNVSASKSIRFDFELFEPTADSFPEFNYSKLLYEEKVNALIIKMEFNLEKIWDHFFTFGSVVYSVLCFFFLRGICSTLAQNCIVDTHFDVTEKKNFEGIQLQNNVMRWQFFFY